jgi:hypothetical protein
MNTTLFNHTINFSRGFFCLLFLSVITISGFSQNTGISDPGALPPAGPPNAAAGLDVNFTNRGLLVPRVALTGAANSTPLNPITSPVAGMVIYNTANLPDVTPGLYVNNGTTWVAVSPKSSAAGDIQYWDGTTWKSVLPGLPGQKLKINSSGVPTWGP